MKKFKRFVYNFYQVSSHVGAVLGVLLVLLLLGAFVVSLAEGIDIGTSLYFAFVTATTIGYGDVTPVTVIGRITSVLLGVIGLVYFGLVVAISTRALSMAATDRADNEKDSP